MLNQPLIKGETSPRSVMSHFELLSTPDTKKLCTVSGMYH